MLSAKHAALDMTPLQEKFMELDKAGRTELDAVLDVLLAEKVGEEGSLVRNQRYRLRTYSSVFKGNELVDRLVKSGHSPTREAAVETGNLMLGAGFFRHVHDDHFFEDGPLFYRFCAHDSISSASKDVSEKHTFVAVDRDRAAKFEALAGRCKEDGSLVGDRKYRLKKYPGVIVGSEVVEWLVGQEDIKDRGEAMTCGQYWVQNGLIAHVAQDHEFKDDFLFYRFTEAVGADDARPDEGEEKEA